MRSVVRLTEMPSATPVSRRSQPAVSLNAQVKIPAGVLFKELAGETVLLNLNTGVYFGLDPIGTRIWQLLQDHRQLQDILPVLLQEFEVDEARCHADLLELVSALCSHGLLTAVSEAAAGPRS